MDKSYPLSSLMIVHLHEVKNDLFCPKEDNVELLGLEVSYYSVKGVLMNLQIIHDQILNSLLVYL